MSVSFRLVLSVLLLSISLPGCSATYSAKPITATVVDSETRQPLSGVIVVAHWELEGGLEGGNSEGNIMVMETITNSQGVFHFPGWGPVSKRTGILGAQLKQKDPQIYLFKIGYRPQSFINESSPMKLRENPEVRVSEWDARSMPLRKFDGDLRTYAEDEILHYSYELSSTMSSQCAWTKLPRTIMAMRELNKAFIAAGIDTGNFYTDLITSEKAFSEEGCSPAKFMQELSK